MEWTIVSNGSHEIDYLTKYTKNLFEKGHVIKIT